MPPVKFLVIGAGVAGLSAIGAAKSMGDIARALWQISSPDDLNKYLAAFTLLIPSVNIVGGFAVTQRMLEMF